MCGNLRHMENAPKFALPEGSWETMKRIIRAYRACEQEENPTVESIAKLAGMHRPVISANNNFLRSLELLQVDKNKLTPIGGRLAAGIAMGSVTLFRASLTEAVLRNPVLARMLGMIGARDGMSVQDFKVELMLLGGISEDSRLLRYVTTILDMLVEADLVRVADNSVTLVNASWAAIRGHAGTEGESLASGVAGTGAPAIAIGVSDSTRVQDKAQVATVNQRTGTEVPLALGPGRLVYVTLPADWDYKKDLRKFLQLAQLALSEEPVE